jgi:serine protease Do
MATPHCLLPSFEFLARVLAPLVFTPPPASAQQVPTDFTAIVKQKTPAVVANTTKQCVEEQE